MLPQAWNGLYNWTCFLYLCCQEEKGATEDVMVGWHHWLDGYEFAQTLGDGEGQESLACSSPWGCKELDMTEQLNNKQRCLLSGGWETRVAELTTDGQAEEQLSSWASTRLASSQPLGPQRMASPKDFPGQGRPSLVPGAAVRCAPAWAEDAVTQGGACSLLALLRLNDHVLTKPHLIHKNSNVCIFPEKKERNNSKWAVKLNVHMYYLWYAVHFTVFCILNAFASILYTLCKAVGTGFHGWFQRFLRAV